MGMPVLVALALSCGGLTAPDARRGTERVLAILGDEGLQILSFENAREPRLRTLGETRGVRLNSVRWNSDGSRVSYQTEEGADENYSYASSPEWLPQSFVRQSASPLSGQWLDQDNLFASNDDSWFVHHVPSNEGSRGSLPGPLAVWSEATSNSALVADVERGHLWLRPGHGPMPLPLPQGLSSVHLLERGARLMVRTPSGSPHTPSEREDVWFVRLRLEAGCSSDDSSVCSWRLWRTKDVAGTDLVMVGRETYYIPGSTGWTHVLSLAQWGTTVEFGGEPGASGEFVMVEWSQYPVIDYQVVFVGRWLYLVPKGLEFAKAPLLRVDVTRPFGQLEVESLGEIEVLPAFHWSTELLMLDGVMYGQEFNRPGKWRKLDLREDHPIGWQKTGLVGELGLRLGEHGLLLLELDGSPLASEPTCNPCKYHAIEDVSDSKSRRLEGTFPAQVLPFGPRGPVLPAPDGSGVLHRSKGEISYEQFENPGTRFPLASIAERSDIYLPATWSAAEQTAGP